MPGGGPPPPPLLLLPQPASNNAHSARAGAHAGGCERRIVKIHRTTPRSIVAGAGPVFIRSNESTPRADYVEADQGRSARASCMSRRIRSACLCVPVLVRIWLR